MTAEPVMLPRRSSTSNTPAATAGGPHVLIRPAKETQTALVWLLGVAVSFLSVGIAGVASPVVNLPPAARKAAGTPPLGVPVQDITMADLAAEEEIPENPPAAADAQESAPDDTPPEPLLTDEDVFEVPLASEIEPALRVLELSPVKPAVTPRTTKTTATPGPWPTAAPTAGGGTSGGTGLAADNASAGSGGRGKFPKPPYPAFAKKQGLTGTVTLTIRVAADGSASSVSVAGGSGSSQLDSHAASWVQSRWRWPAGAPSTCRVPVSFKLR